MGEYRERLKAKVKQKSKKKITLWLPTELIRKVNVAVKKYNCTKTDAIIVALEMYVEK